MIPKPRAEGAIQMKDIMDVIAVLDEGDRQKLSEFAHILMRQKKYEELRKEVEARRTEIRNGEILSH